jgi:glycosyltransferase involved in cell wall biosynthesis
MAAGADDSPLVSVIVPAHNAAAYLGETLRSALSQSYRNIEVIVVDDGSSDETGAIAERFAWEDRRVRVVHLEMRRGVAAARNAGIRQSHGELIAPLDADDVWYPQKLEKQVARMLHSPPQVGVVYAWSAHLDDRGELTGGANTASESGDVLLGMIIRNFIGHASAPLIKRSCLDRVGLYDTRFAVQHMQGCEDRDLYLRLAEHYHFAVVPELLIGYRRHDAGMSRSVGPMARCNQILLSEMQGRHPEIPAEVFRWARSHFSDYLSNQCSQSGDYLGALRWMMRAVCDDPALLSEPRVLRRLVMAPVKLALRPVLAVLGVADREMWTGAAETIFVKRPASLEALKQAHRRRSRRSRLMDDRLARVRRKMQESGRVSHSELSDPQLGAAWVCDS